MSSTFFTALLLYCYDDNVCVLLWETFFENCFKSSIEEQAHKALLAFESVDQSEGLPQIRSGGFAFLSCGFLDGFSDRQHEMEHSCSSTVALIALLGLVCFQL